MNPYRTLGTTIGTREAVDLAHRLAMWHDAMVIHQRGGRHRSNACEADCPHAEAQSLWLEAVDVYGERAHALGFLRTMGRSMHSATPRGRGVAYARGGR